MANAKIKDMTVGSPMKLVLGFALPLLFGNLFLIPAYFYVKGKLRRRFEEEGEKEPMLRKKQC